MLQLLVTPEWLSVTQTLFVHTTPEEFKTQQSLVILDLCLRKTGVEKSRDCHDVIVFEKLCFKMFCFHTKGRHTRRD